MHHYPFGLRHFDAPAPTPAYGEAYRYGYTGKELVDEGGLNWKDYGARWYDPALARWGGVDPLADMMTSWSPYNYVFDNPISYIDPTGMVPSGYSYNWGTSQYERADGSQVSWSEVSTTLRSTGELSNLPTHRIYEDEFPGVYAHTVAAQAANPQWKILTYDGDKGRARKRREEALANVPSMGKIFDRDEYPYASTFEGGAGASVAYVFYMDNQGAGTELSIFIATELKNKKGAQFFVLPVPSDGTRERKYDVEPGIDPVYYPVRPVVVPYRSSPPTNRTPNSGPVAPSMFMRFLRAFPVIVPCVQCFDQGNGWQNPRGA